MEGGVSKQRKFWSGFCGNIKLKNSIPNHPRRSKQWYLLCAAIVTFIVSQLPVLDIEQGGKIDKGSKSVTLPLLVIQLMLAIQLMGTGEIRNTENWL